MRSYVAAIWLAIVSILSQSLWLNKAIHVDDPLYLGIAERILSNPLDPLGDKMKWGESTNFEHPNPPGWPYLLALTAKCFGWNEYAFHLLELTFFTLFAIGFFALASHLTRHAFFWTQAILLSPVIAPGLNVMADVPMLACWCWALHFYFHGIETGQLRHYLIAGILATMTISMKYTGLLLLPLFCTASWCNRSKLLNAAVVIPVVAFVLWNVLNYLQFGRLHCFSNSHSLQEMEVVARVRIILRNTGGVMWMTLPWIALQMFIGVKARWKTLATMMIAIGLGWFDMTRSASDLERSEITVQPWIKLQFLVFTANGVLAMCLPLLSGARRFGTMNDPVTWKRRAVQAWWILGIAFNVFAVMTVSVGAIRHLHAFLIPSVLIVATGFDDVLQKFTARRIAYVATLPSVVIAFLLMHADFELAKVNQILAQDFVKPNAAKRTTWVPGDPAVWYYSESVGGKRWTNQDPAPGDAIALTYWKARNFESSPTLKKSQIREQQNVETWNPLRTTSLLANYYAGNTLVLPWEFSLTKFEDQSGKSSVTIPPLDQIAVFIVR